MPPENKEIFVISNVGLNSELDKIDNDVNIKRTSFEDALKLIGEKGLKKFSLLSFLPFF